MSSVLTQKNEQRGVTGQQALCSGGSEATGTPKRYPAESLKQFSTNARLIKNSIYSCTQNQKTVYYHYYGKSTQNHSTCRRDYSSRGGCCRTHSQGEAGDGGIVFAKAKKFKGLSPCGDGPFLLSGIGAGTGRQRGSGN